VASKISTFRTRAFLRQRGLCFYCDLPMWRSEPTRFAVARRLTLSQAREYQCTGEHLMARCEGGTDNRDNIVAACLFCNRTRHRRKRPPAPEVWRAIQQRRVCTRSLAGGNAVGKSLRR
jgi:hypothetical protein